MSFTKQTDTFIGFVPKQAKALTDGRNKVTTYESTGGAVTSQFAAHLLTLIPAIPANSIIHDNAAGNGTVSRKILANNPAPSIKIHVTDLDQVFLDVLQDDISANSWPIDTGNDKLEALSFADDYFTHSFTNISIFFAANAGLDGAKEVYRTLQPGGVALANCWETVSWLPPMKATHDVVRPGKPFPLPSTNWSDGTHLKKIFIEAGFKEENVRLEKSEAWAKTSDLRKWAELTWAFLGGVGGWQESDEERWEEAVETLQKSLLASGEERGIKVVGEETWLRASQWVIVASK